MTSQAAASLSESQDTVNSNGNVVEINVPAGWSGSQVARVLKRDMRKRKSNAPPCDDEPSDSDDDRTTGRPARAKRQVFPPAEQEKYDDAVQYFKHHYSRYFSVKENELEAIIHRFFGPTLSHNSNLYIEVRWKLLKCVRNWQYLWIQAFEGRIAETVSSAELRLKEYSDLHDIFQREFSLETFQSIMEGFAKEVVDYRLCTEPATLMFCQNIFIWFGTFIRRAHHFPGEEGKEQGLPNGLFNRIKLIARASGFENIKIEDIPKVVQKPAIARRAPRKKPKTIEETCEDFQILPLK